MEIATIGLDIAENVFQVHAIGVTKTLMRNGRDRRLGKPAVGHARKERALLVGTRSADHIRASGLEPRRRFTGSLLAPTQK